MKQLSSRIRSKILRRILLSTAGMMFTNWIFQGMRYMSFFEVCHRICFEIIVFILLFVLFNIILKSLYAFLFALIISHSIMWLINGHFFALIRWRKIKPDRFICYINELYERLSDAYYLRGVAIFGGLCKGKYNIHSDVDLRVIKSDGFLNLIRACNYGFFERMRAFIHGFPLEVYVFDSVKELDKEDKTQVSPIILYDPKNELRDKYPAAKDFLNFKREFLSIFVKGKN